MITEQKKILIVEDDFNFGNILKDYLILNDYFVVLAKNGIEGMEKPWRHAMVQIVVFWVSSVSGRVPADQGVGFGLVVGVWIRASMRATITI